MNGPEAPVSPFVEQDKIGSGKATVENESTIDFDLNELKKLE